MASSSPWQGFQRYLLEYRQLGFSLDISRMKFPDELFEMESLGKEKNLAGEIVHQGIAVYGNKGSTDQHSYVQQLRDGALNFFVTFVEVRDDRRGGGFDVEDGITSGDYLERFLRGTRNALYEKGRESITMSIPEVNAFYIGALIAQPSAFMARSVISTLTISPASKQASKRQVNCCSSRSKCACSFPAKVRLPKRSRAQSMPTRRMFFTYYGIWGAAMHESKLRSGSKLPMVNFARRI